MDFSHEQPTTPPQHRRERRALQPPQFTLQTLFMVMASLGVLFGLMTAAGPIGGFALLLLVLVIIAHVAGNSIGTRLRNLGSEPVDEDDSSRKRANPSYARVAAAPASNLSSSSSVTLTMLIFSAAGAVIVGSLGSALLIWLAWNELNVATAIIATASPTVLGALLGFAVSSFTQTAGGAWREASDSYRQEKLRRQREMVEAAAAAQSYRD